MYSIENLGTLVIKKCIQYNAEGYKGLALIYTLLKKYQSRKKYVHCERK